MTADEQVAAVVALVAAALRTDSFAQIAAGSTAQGSEAG
jgi:hypothetical protein